eukprot:10763201-Lingulodinium_polyedra.AAC.1
MQIGCNIDAASMLRVPESRQLLRPSRAVGTSRGCCLGTVVMLRGRCLDAAWLLPGGNGCYADAACLMLGCCCDI